MPSRCRAGQRPCAGSTSRPLTPEPPGGPAAGPDPGVLDMAAVDVDVNHRRVDPFMPEYLLNCENVHAVAVKPGGGVVPQQMRGQLSGVPGQVPGDRVGQAEAPRGAGDRAARAVAMRPL